MLKGHAKFLVVTAAVLTASCLDFSDPLTVDEPASVDPAEIEEPMPTASSNSQSASPVIHESFRARFNLTFSVAGSALVSGSPITVTLNGEAIEDLASGTIEVMLPTQAEMAHAGDGKRPSYPQGQKFPVVARWQLPSMSAGDTWSRTVSIGSVDNGYYQIAATINTTAPAGRVESFISNDMFREAWLLVNTSGGQVTGVFDETVIPTGSAKVPGPFRAEGTSPVKTPGQTAAYGGDASMAYSMSGYLWLNVVYMHDSTQKPAKGASVHSNTIDEDGEEQDTETKTVPSSGYVRLRCPSSGESLLGTVSLPANSEVGSGSFNAYWDAHPNECGDTISVRGTAHTYLPWHYLKLSIPLVDSGLDERRSRMNWSSDPEDTSGTVYNTALDRIDFRGPDSYAERWVGAHEYAHALHHESLGGLLNINCRGHKVWQPLSYGCALQEGMADYAAQVGAPGDDYAGVTSFEYAPNAAPDEDPKIEGYVAMLFHDLLDSANEGNDDTDYGASYVFRVFETCSVRVGSSWHGINDVSDFVWCLELGVDSSEHEDQFGDIPTPSQIREWADEPGNHDDEDIRRTWKQNLVG